MTGAISFFTSYGFIFEILLSFVIFTYQLKGRKLWYIRVIPAIGLLFLFGYLRDVIPYLNAWTESLKYVFLYAMCFGLLMFIFKGSVRNILFCTVGASLSQHCAYRLADLLRFSVSRESLLVQNTLYIIGILLVNFIFWLLLARKNGREEKFTTFSSFPSIFLSLAVLLVCVLFQQLYEQYAVSLTDALYVIFACFDIAACIFVAAFQYEVFHSSRLYHDYKVLDQMLRLQKRQMKENKETIDLINIKCHDLKKQIAELGSKNNISKEEIDEINHAISIYDGAVKTGSEPLDILLAEKTLTCSNKKIQFECIADGRCLSFMKSSDIYSLFGNAIDNAIEAVEKIEEDDKRCISVSIKESKGMVISHFENNYSGKLDFLDGLPLTTKRDKQYHGFGMKSIKMLVEKYSGYISITSDDNVFSLNILIPIPNKKQ